MRKIFTLLCLVATFSLNAQTIKSAVGDTIQTTVPQELHFNYKQIVIPAVFISYGLIGLKSDALIDINEDIRKQTTESSSRRTTIDNFSQYAPAVSVYALNALGIPGKHNFRDRTIILATSYILMSATVMGLKSVTKVERPDGSANNSVPSGHTATAFAGAEFMYQEYKDQSIWYGVAGYAVATGTAYLRIYNDRHWFTDIVAGAGIGILSTKVAYWLNPYISTKILHTKKKLAICAPFYNGNQVGLIFVKAF